MCLRFEEFHRAKIQITLTMEVDNFVEAEDAKLTLSVEELDQFFVWLNKIHDQQLISMDEAEKKEEQDQLKKEESKIPDKPVALGKIKIIGDHTSQLPTFWAMVEGKRRVVVADLAHLQDPEIPEPELVDIIKWSDKAREEQVALEKAKKRNLENISQLPTPLAMGKQALTECSNCHPGKKCRTSSWAMCEACLALEPTKLFSTSKGRRQWKTRFLEWDFTQVDIKTVMTQANCDQITAIEALMAFNVVDAIIYLNH